MRLQEEETTRDWRGVWGRDRGKKKPGIERVKTQKERGEKGGRNERKSFLSIT